MDLFNAIMNTNKITNVVIVFFKVGIGVHHVINYTCIGCFSVCMLFDIRLRLCVFNRFSL